MLRSTQEEQYKYFYIDRKLGSGNLQQINDALDEIQLFLGKMKKIDLINSLVLRIMDLISNNKSLVLKHRVASIFKHHKNTLLNIHCKDQIANTLLKYIKTSDEHTRLVSLQIISDLPALFLKDIAVYHILLAKLAQNNCLSKTQKKQSIVCLTIILTHSKQIARLFTRSLDKLLKYYFMPLPFIFYLLSQVVIETHLQLSVLQWGMRNMEQMGKANQKEKRKALKYFQKIVIRCASSNYHIIDFYHQKKLNVTLPNIAGSIKKIREQKYQFLIPDSIQIERSSLNLTLDQLIDELHQKKKTGHLQKDYQTYQEKIYSVIDEYLSEQKETQKIILLLYFVEENISHYDRLIKKYIINKRLIPSKSLFKKLVVVGCFQSAICLISFIDMPQTNYIFLKLYFQFKIQKEPKNIDQLKQTAQILNEQLFIIVSIWEKIDKIIKKWLLEVNLSNQILNQLKDLHNSIKGTAKFPELCEIVNIFAKTNENASFANLKNQFYHLLPSSMMSTHSFWFAHLNKQSILAFFNMVI